MNFVSCIIEIVTIILIKTNVISINGFAIRLLESKKGPKAKHRIRDQTYVTWLLYHRNGEKTMFRYAGLPP